MNNMILAVGPETPASTLWRSEDESSLDSGVSVDVTMEVHMAHSDDSSHNDQEEKSEKDDDEECSEQEEDGDDEDQSSTGDSSNERLLLETEISRIVAARRQMNEDDDDDDDNDSSEDEMFQGHGQSSHWKKTPTLHPSIRHGGCINTACWMTCPWQLSSGKGHSSNSAPFSVAQHECPTQLITSGDDRLVKIWDVKDAMGMTSPLEGGWDTYTPFANTPKPDAHAARKSWKAYHRERLSEAMPGSVVHLATLVTGHRGNVFHVTPVKHLPGKVLTCGADGTLRLSDMETETSTIVTNLGERSHFIFNSTMAFSHVSLTENTGLLCSEEGLHRFDLRLPPREQDRRSLLSGVGEPFTRDYCKSCAVWSPYTQRTDGDKSAHWESSYVFAGGRSEYVALLDLRAVGGSRIVETYKPRCLNDTQNVSVSGLDVSKDSRELLVSYENDQIYSFPILPWLSRSAPPTLEHIEKCESSSQEVVHELAAYGGHLNRFTFLKNAKYAGPNDDYICTGSDSGCGWIYDRKTGAAVSLLGADKSTCNGLVSHPSLPFFISYGIDSTAKLWRASTPVSHHADDSPSGRALRAADEPYEMSVVGRSWEIVRRLVERDTVPAILPDFVTNPGAVTTFRIKPQPRNISGPKSPIFGNALRVLPSLLRRNQHECYRQAQKSSSSHRLYSPVEQPVEEFSHRVSLSRLCSHAHQLGLRWDPNAPWVFQTDKSATATNRVHPAELVPEHPSDWLLFDESMGGTKHYLHRNFNTDEFLYLLRETFEEDPLFLSTHHGEALPPWLKDSELPSKEEVLRCQWIDRSTSEDTVRRRQVFLATIHLLKNAGNEASKENKLCLAARRYDKTLQYCAFALMKHQLSKNQFRHLACRDPFYHCDEESDAPVWDPILHVFVATRLNLSFLLLRPEFSDALNAAKQASLALDYLTPFAGAADASILALQAKAHFRLGSAKLDLGCYRDAIECFEASVRDSRNAPAGKPDKLVVSRLREAKRILKRKNAKCRAKFQRALLRAASDESS